jgi:ATP-binding cassette, subfamily C (CFTR/MRP), member 1
MDEATSSLDPESDSIIQRIIKTEFTQSTVLTIAHRIHTVLHYDKILVLDKGEVAEFDSPQVLLQDPSSKFSMLLQEACRVNSITNHFFSLTLGQ